MLLTLDHSLECLSHHEAGPHEPVLNLRLREDPFSSDFASHYYQNQAGNRLRNKAFSIKVGGVRLLSLGLNLLNYKETLKFKRNN